MKVSLVSERVFKGFTAGEGGFNIQSRVAGNQPEAGHYCDYENQENYKFAITGHSNVLSDI